MSLGWNIEAVDKMSRMLGSDRIVGGWKSVVCEVCCCDGS